MHESPWPTQRRRCMWVSVAAACFSSMFRLIGSRSAGEVASCSCERSAFPSSFTLAGGLDEQVTEAVVRAAFIPFGEIKDVNMPLDHETQKNRGFGFVTFEEK